MRRGVSSGGLGSTVGTTGADDDLQIRPVDGKERVQATAHHTRFVPRRKEDAHRWQCLRMRRLAQHARIAVTHRTIPRNLTSARCSAGTYSAFAAKRSGETNWARA